MSQEVMIAGALFSDVPSIRVPDSNGNFHPFTDVSDTTAAAADVATGKYFYAADGTRTAGTSSGGGGGGIGTLIAEQALGTISTSSTTATNTGKTVTVSGVDSYDFLIVEISQTEVVNNRHMASVRAAVLTAQNGGAKTGIYLLSYPWNCRKRSDGYATRVGSSSSTAYGVYPFTASLSNGVATLIIYMRYSDDYTGTIDGDYTARVYGVNLIDLIGG